jgi:hypothetical protein
MPQLRPLRDRIRPWSGPLREQHHCRVLPGRYARPMTDPARVAVLVLTLAAFFLPTIAALLAYRSAVAAVSKANREANEYERIYTAFMAEYEATPRDGRRDVAAEYESRYAAIGYPAPTYTNAVSAPMHATARAVRSVLAGARSNAWLALLGLACGLAASVWSLYLPNA